MTPPVKRVSITCWVDAEEEAVEMMRRIFRKHDTWEEMREKEVAPPKSSTAVPDAVIPASTRANVSPGEPTIGKIGADSKALILSELSTGTIQPHAKYVEHCKLLWKRGEVKYDGKEYYL